eukprot:TRINITY_DN4139_c0_g1_i6.p2 TRINITY_DN4139_c0_g1~~TRINITY_DN4139_c0_g1_i6.p2  ORF type:complete len:102 (-),score=28.19 TRINITY_DN4139_c0_g1_i6:72-377(-)
MSQAPSDSLPISSSPVVAADAAAAAAVVMEPPLAAEKEALFKEVSHVVRGFVLLMAQLKLTIAMAVAREAAVVREAAMNRSFVPIHAVQSRMALNSVIVQM